MDAAEYYGGQVVDAHTVRSPGVPTHIELSADYAGRDLTADGSNWIRVYARLCDSRGTTYPYGNDAVNFRVDGPGAVIGGANIGANPTRAEVGIATALARATTTPGTLTVHGGAFGLQAAQVSIQSRPSPGAMWPPAAK